MGSSKTSRARYAEEMRATVLWSLGSSACFSIPGAFLEFPIFVQFSLFFLWMMVFPVVVDGVSKTNPTYWAFASFMGDVSYEEALKNSTLNVFGQVIASFITLSLGELAGGRLRESVNSSVAPPYESQVLTHFLGEFLIGVCILFTSVVVERTPTKRFSKTFLISALWIYFMTLARNQTGATLNPSAMMAVSFVKAFATFDKPFKSAFDFVWVYVIAPLSAAYVSSRAVKSLILKGFLRKPGTHCPIKWSYSLKLAKNAQAAFKVTTAY